MSKLNTTDIKKIVDETPPGAWIWRLANIDPNYLKRLAQVGCKRIYLKVFDDRNGTMADDFFWDFQCSDSLIRKFNGEGIRVVGWGYHFDQRTSIPVEEEVKAVKMAMECGLDGYILDVEAEVKSPRAKAPLKDLLDKLRKATGSKFLGYTSFGHPGKHSEVPWKLLDTETDIAFPQIYFEKWRFGSTDAKEVQAALEAHDEIGLQNPILPIWGSEEDATVPASAATLQDYLDRFIGSSVFRIPNIGQKGQAWNLNYSSTTRSVEIGTVPEDLQLLGPYTKELRHGSKDSTTDKSVSLLQRTLAARGFDPGKIDGDFGPKTESAVRRFQRINDLTTDGIVGPITWSALGGTVKSPEAVFASGARERLASIAETEASLGLSWNGPDSKAEKYLKPFRKPMQKLGHIGSKPVFYNWCAAFVAYCVRQAGYDIPDQPEGHGATMALVETWKAWAKDQDYWHTKDSTIPQRGDLVCFEWFDGDASLDHIGIVRQGPGNGTMLQTAEGNRNNKTVNGTRSLANVAGIIRLRDK